MQIKKLKVLNERKAKINESMFKVSENDISKGTINYRIAETTELQTTFYFFFYLSLYQIDFFYVNFKKNSNRRNWKVL